MLVTEVVLSERTLLVELTLPLVMKGGISGGVSSNTSKSFSCSCDVTDKEGDSHLGTGLADLVWLTLEWLPPLEL